VAIAWPPPYTDFIVGVEVKYAREKDGKIKWAKSAAQHLRICAINSLTMSVWGSIRVALVDIIATPAANGEGMTQRGKFMIQGTEDPRNPPFLCRGLTNFIELRGGDYFFIPSMPALKMMSTGTADPY